MLAGNLAPAALLGAAMARSRCRPAAVLPASGARDDAPSVVPTLGPQEGFDIADGVNGLLFTSYYDLWRTGDGGMTFAHRSPGMPAVRTGMPIARARSASLTWTAAAIDWYTS